MPSCKGTSTYLQEVGKVSILQIKKYLICSIVHAVGYIMQYLIIALDVQ